MDQGARQDPIELLCRQEAGRLAWLVPVRHSRMAENAFAFFRGAAVVMAADLARKPHSGLMVQLCGDAICSTLGSMALLNANCCLISMTSMKPILVHLSGM